MDLGRKGEEKGTDRVGRTGGLTSPVAASPSADLGGPRGDWRP